MDKNFFKQQIKAAAKHEICDLVIKNITIVDVFQNDSFISDVAIKDGYIVGIGNYEGKTTINGSGKYICPGLIDAHAHIESSLTTPDEYYKAALINGITSIITDPHEIANVLGIEGIELMINLSENLPLDFYFMLSSCVPATDFESSGAKLESEDLLPLYNNEKVLGLAEVMNAPAVLNCDENMINKIWDAKEKGLVIDGHGAGFDETMINTYATANIVTDHECHNPQEVIDRLRRGMYVLIREGTVAKNLKELIQVASIANSRRICICTDDKHIDDLIKNGSVNQSIRMAISYGLKPETAIQMCTLNTSECYKLKHKGAIAPGFVADFIILDNLEEFKIDSVYKNGNLVVKENKLLCNIEKKNIKKHIKNSIVLPSLNKDSFCIDIKDKSILNAIQIIPNKLESNHLKINIDDLESKEKFAVDSEKDLIKIAVIERHKATGNIGLGVINGLNMKEGAIGTTIAHDSHNIILAGCNDEDMIFAANELKNIGGGIIVVKNKKVLASIQLEIGGLITVRDSKEVISDLNRLHEAVNEIAPDINFNPFLTLSFLSLPVIPTLKITDKGLFDVIKFQFIESAI
ncbi:adenine deaminase [Clostridium botulinum]|uniref:adenine deaminase n=1 Tax=Clostridium botulinum TaxID=1491 RepID=UPI000C78AF59|nr:adenine deaminase [Clostridium botulinum]AUN21945.1 adenine deaminase [Clostridium botulinum]AUN25798.1 adenine deaminase [Clostridium botulinum]QDY21423.1 adenine deaminase [Clostridium botulinum]